MKGLKRILNGGVKNNGLLNGKLELGLNDGLKLSQDVSGIQLLTVINLHHEDTMYT